MADKFNLLPLSSISNWYGLLILVEKYSCYLCPVFPIGIVFKLWQKCAICYLCPVYAIGTLFGFLYGRQVQSAIFVQYVLLASAFLFGL